MKYAYRIDSMGIMCLTYMYFIPDLSHTHLPGEDTVLLKQHIMIASLRVLATDHSLQYN